MDFQTGGDRAKHGFGVQVQRAGAVPGFLGVVGHIRGDQILDEPGVLGASEDDGE